MKDAILKAIKIAGAKSIADACNEISVQAVHKWAIKGVPAERCPTIERLTDGEVTCEQLRPDVDWAYLRSDAKNAA